MANLKELLEKRGEAVSAIKSLRDVVENEDRDFTPEEQENWDKANSDHDSLTRKIDILQRGEEIETENRNGAEEEARSFRENGEFRKGGTDSPEQLEEQRATAMQGWANFQIRGELTDEQRSACDAVGVNPNAKEFPFMLTRKQPQLADFESRALASGATATGGAVVPQGFMNSLEKAMLQFGPMLQVADILRTTSGEDIPWPTANDTTNEGAMVAESGSIPNNADPAFGEVTFKAHKVTSKIIVVPVELLEDSAFDLVAELGAMIGERIGRCINNKVTVGSGSSEASGLITDAATINTATASTMTADDFISLFYSVDGAYRQNGKYMMNDAILKAVRMYKDSNGQYIWQPSYQAGQPESLLGYPAYSNNHMASAVSDGNVVAAFGDLKKYKIRQVRQVRMRRLVELYAGNDQEGFVGFLRFDGHLLNAGTNPVKTLTVQSA